MILIVNGEKIEVKEESNILDVINLLEKKSEFFAVALNKIFVPKSQYSNFKLKENDQLEVVIPHPGG
jgi:sulfur carrier protein